MKKILLRSLAFSILFLLLLNLTFGTYFEGYEPIINSIFSGEFSSQMNFTFFVSTWFGLSAVCSFLTHYFDSSFVYSWACTALNLLILTSFTACFILLVKSKSLALRHAFLIYLAFLLIYLESVIYVYNLRISFFSLLAAFFYFSAIQEFNLSKRNYPLVFILAFIGIFSRLEIAIVAAFILLLFSALFYRKAMVFSVIVFVASLSVFAFYKTYEHRVYPDCEIVLNVEHEFGDKESVSPNDFSDRATKLKLNAMAQYIQDDDVYDVNDILKYTSSKTMLEYLKFEKLPQIYLRKLGELFDLLESYWWLFFLTLCITVFTSYTYFKSQNRWPWGMLRVLALTGVIFLIILALNLLVICPHNLIVVILSAYCMVCIAYLSFHFHQSKTIKQFLLYFIVAQLFFLGKHLYSLHSLQGEKYAKAKALRALMIDLAAQKKQIVFATGSHYDNYPARLFSRLLEQRITHYYADFFLSRYPFFERHNEVFFGRGYSQMKSKLLTVSDNQNVVYLSNDNYNEFLIEYVRFFHQMELQLIPLETNVDLHDLQDLKPYRVHLPKN